MAKRLSVSGAPFDAEWDDLLEKYDRVSYAKDIAKYFGSFYKNGVIPKTGGVLSDELKVTWYSGMNVSVTAGSAVINGRVCWQDSTSQTLDLDVGGALPRIDRIVLELDVTSEVREFSLKVLKGTEAVTPVGAALTTTDDVYQLCIAEITVPNGTSIINPSNIADKRSDTSLCGIATAKYAVVTSSQIGLMSTSDKSKLDGVEAEANKYIHPTNAGNKHIPTGGTTNQFLKFLASGEAQWSPIVSDVLNLTAATQSLFSGLPTVDAALQDLKQKMNFSNLTLFRINTTDATSGSPVVGYTISVTGANPPTTTQYVTNSSGYLYLLLPYGSYTIKFLDTIIGYNMADIVISSSSGNSYYASGAIFTRTASKQYTMDTTKTYKKAPYISTIDMWMCGGGGSGGNGGALSSWWGSGGGGGYTRTVFGLNVSAYADFSPTIGAGGRQGGSAVGGTTSFLGYSAAGGVNGTMNDTNGVTPGGNGGSGGGGSSTGVGGGGSGGSDGSAGGAGESYGGSGQGSTTRLFNEPGNTLYCGGGGGCKGGAAGAGGGGKAASSSGNGGDNATAYGGGGGAAWGNNSSSRDGGAGGNGVIIIRWA